MVQNKQADKKGNPIVILLLCVTLLSSGCAKVSGIGKFGTNADAAAAIVEETPPPEAAQQELTLLEDIGPARGGTLRLFMLPTDSLDPLRSLDPYVMDYGWFLYDPLVRIDGQGVITPFLAETLQSSQEGRIWDVKLREGIQFHDGSELSADDVVFSIDHAGKAGGDSAYGASLANVASLEVLSRLQVRIILKQPDVFFTRNLCFPILSGKSWKADPDGKTGILKPVGTGAFRFSLRDDTGITLANNETWWNSSPVGDLKHPIWPDNIRFVFGTGEADRIKMFQQRQIDATWTQAVDKIRYANRKDLEYREFPGTRMEFAAIGSNGTGVRDPAVRSLLMRYLVGCAREGGLVGEAVASAALTPLTQQEVVPLLTAAGCKLRKVGERQVLSVPGTYGWRPAVMTIQYHSLNLERMKTAEWITGVLGRIGVEVFKEEATSAEEKKLAGNGRFDMMLLGCESPALLADEGMLAAMRSALGTKAAVSELVPLYRERRAMLYNTRIRGEKKPSAGFVYDGWFGWYLLETADASN